MIVNEATAAQVRHLFQRYLELGSVTALAREIGIVRDANNDPASRLGRMSRGQLYHLLSNPIYVGKIRHHDRIYDGEHQGIIEPRHFDRVQASLADKAPQRRNRSNLRDVHLLTGLIFDDTGDRLSPTHASNHGRRYRYYVSHRLKIGARDKSSGWRIAAGELEGIALRQASELLLDRLTLARWLQDHASVNHVEEGLGKAETIATSLHGDSDPAASKDLLQTIFRRIVLAPEAIRFVVDRQALVQRLFAPTGCTSGAGSSSLIDSSAEHTIVIDRPIAIKRRGVEPRIVIDGSAGRDIDTLLVELIARAHFYLARLCDGSVSSIAELAGELAIHRADISRILPLAFLAPQIVDAIFGGRQPPDMTARRLSRLVDIPPCWANQAKVLGI